MPICVSPGLSSSTVSSALRPGRSRPQARPSRVDPSRARLPLAPTALPMGVMLMARCRVIATSNGITSLGDQRLVRRWAPWLDPNHPNPAKSGELRWFIRGARDADVEVPGPATTTSLGARTRSRRCRAASSARGIPTILTWPRPATASASTRRPRTCGARFARVISRGHAAPHPPGHPDALGRSRHAALDRASAGGSENDRAG
jgi:hypothetical protein